MFASNGLSLPSFDGRGLFLLRLWFAPILFLRALRSTRILIIVSAVDDAAVLFFPIRTVEAAGDT